MMRLMLGKSKRERCARTSRRLTNVRSMRNLNAFLVTLAAGGLVLLGCEKSVVPESPADSFEVPLQAAAHWPKFRRNGANTGYSPHSATYGGSQPWSLDTGKGIFSSPVIDKDGVVYIGSANAQFYAVKSDGSIKWQRAFGDLVDSAALIDDDGVLYVGSGDGHLYALNRQTGETKWTFQPKGGAFISWFEGNVAIGKDGLLYVGNDDFHLYGIDRKTGKELWSAQTGDQVWSAAAVDENGRAFFGCNDLKLRALDPANKSGDLDDSDMEWAQVTIGSVVSSPVVTQGGLVVVGSFDGHVYAFDKSTGEVAWIFATGDHVYASPAAAPDGTIYIPSADGTLYALDEEGGLLWTYDTLAPIRSSPAVDGAGTIYFGGGDGRLYAINSDGTRRWSFDTSSGDRNDLNASPALGKDAVLVAGEEGKLWSVPYDYCLNATDARCDSNSEIAPGEESAALYWLSSGGSAQPSVPTEIAMGDALGFRLVVRENGSTVRSFIDESKLVLKVEPAVDYAVEVSADRSFLVVAPNTMLSADTNYTISISGEYLQGGLRIGNKYSGGIRAGSFEHTFTVRTEAAKVAVVKEPTEAKAQVFDISRLAAPNPTLLPSYNQIGFDFMHLLAGVVEVDEEKGTALVWVVAGKVEDGNLLVDASSNQRIAYPMEVAISDNALLFESAGFKIEFGQVELPIERMRIGASIDEKGKGLRGVSIFGHTTCGNIEHYASLLDLAGLCHPETDKLVIHGTAEIAEVQAGGKRPEGLAVESVSIEEAKDGTPGKVKAILSGNLPSADHLMSILLIDKKTGKPFVVNYSQETTNVTNAASQVSEVVLSFEAGKGISKGAVEVIVLHDLYPVARVSP
jgi:outer membrane protein assembly factor BamB